MRPADVGEFTGQHECVPHVLSGACIGPFKTGQQRGRVLCGAAAGPVVAEIDVTETEPVLCAVQFRMRLIPGQQFRLPGFRLLRRALCKQVHFLRQPAPDNRVAQFQSQRPGFPGEQFFVQVVGYQAVQFFRPRLPVRPQLPGGLQALDNAVVDDDLTLGSVVRANQGIQEENQAAGQEKMRQGFMQYLSH